MSTSPSTSPSTDPTRRSAATRAGGTRSARVALYVATALSAALAVAAVVDQAGARRLQEHAEAAYAPHQVEPSAAVLYGSLYTVAGLGVVLWLLVVRAVHARSRWPAPVLGTIAIVTGGSLALLLLLADEYDERIFPAGWGLLAGLSPLAGCVAMVLLLRRPGRRVPMRGDRDG